MTALQEQDGTQPQTASLQDKHIVLGITGSIAAYKACLLIRLLRQAGAEVQVVITPAGKEFITPVTLSALSQKPVISDFFAQRDGTWHSHVDLGLWADAFVVAPATANTLAKMAGGVADNMLLTTYLSMKAPTFVAPAMDLDMYAHAATQQNLQTLRERGVRVIEPGSGFLASGLEGKGRMEEPDRIIACLEHFFGEPYAQSGTIGMNNRAALGCHGRTLLITAGPTREAIDPVRFLSNYSTGKMGLALVREGVRRGAHVQLICGPVSEPLEGLPKDVEVTRVESARQMYEAAVRLFPTVDAAILCAAVADFTPAEVSPVKLKRQGDELILRLQPTEDIAAALGRMKRPGQVLAGFALETHDELAHAQEKMRRKGLDFIVLNSLRDEGAGFAGDTNKVTILTDDGQQHPFPLKDKGEVAKDIIDQLSLLLCTRDGT